jgi:hypothetical protein
VTEKKTRQACVSDLSFVDFDLSSVDSVFSWLSNLFEIATITKMTIRFPIACAACQSSSHKVICVSFIAVSLANEAADASADVIFQ